jgi:secondary thiamine-phosphate synthase enzyme
LQQALTTLEIVTLGRGLFEITASIESWLADQPVSDGLLTVFIRHTSASLIVSENADPDVQADLNDFFESLAPEGRGLYRHDAEGPDDMPAHIRNALTLTQVSIPMQAGRLRLGTWQGVFVFEHRRTSCRRQVDLHLLGE